MLMICILTVSGSFPDWYPCTKQNSWVYTQQNRKRKWWVSMVRGAEISTSFGSVNKSTNSQISAMHWSYTYCYWKKITPIKQRVHLCIYGWVTIASVAPDWVEREPAATPTLCRKLDKVNDHKLVNDSVARWGGFVVCAHNKMSATVWGNVLAMSCGAHVINSVVCIALLTLDTVTKQL